MSEKLQLDQPAEGVARLTISNPERRGALDHEILDALAEHARTLDARCLVIRGSGEVFSAGYDIGNLSEQGFEESAEKLVAHPFHDALEALEAYRYPVVAEVNGHAIGGGSSWRSPRTSGSPPRREDGHAAREAGADLLAHRAGEVHRRVRARNTAELFFVGRNVEADRALEMGLVNEVVDPGALDERVLDLAGEIAANAPLSLAGNKQMIRELRRLRLPEDLERELVELRESCFALRGLPRGRAGLHGEAKARVARALTVSDDAPVLADVSGLLQCPVCSSGLALGDGAVRCGAGHSFDVARQGYVNLVPGNGDSAEMVEAREAFLGAGHFRPLTGALVAEAMNVEAAGAVVDVGAGTGHHLAYVLATPPERPGVALDTSTAALRRAARIHPRAAAVGADAWKPLPLRDGIAAIVLSVFAPRNPDELARILAPGGALLAVTPRPAISRSSWARSGCSRCRTTRRTGSTPS